MVRSIIRRKCLTKWRLLDRYYLVVIDATGYVGFRKEHCSKCLRRELRDGSIYYYHPVLEAKIVTANGLAISIGTEFIENIPGKDTQDCELMASYRLVKKIKRDFPQLSICLLLDGLYAKRPIFKICEKYKWKYIITLKEGAMPSVYKWYELIRDTMVGKKHKEIVYKEKLQHYRWIQKMEFYGDDDLYNIFECVEEGNKRKDKKDTKFVWITNFDITETNVNKLANQGGRLRWKIENEGFNSQKNGGYELEHAYSHHPTGMKNFYILMQIAHIIDQLVQKGSLMKKAIIKEIGSIKNIAILLLEGLRNNPLDLVTLEQRIQIRLDSS